MNEYSVFKDGKVVGAIGVSSGSHEQDPKIALAAIVAAGFAT
ncbi:heme-binding protein [Rhizobium leguminosarum]|nr:heme-binding protein [Rhizobium leguminosarum]MBY2915377.1 hypothetical protein [Rhizobium leguminosarum]MBY2970915.1 hypothetical protein [Rhizobium leguminosarum]MBY2977982.1 hypothetical protein [Rhizobium leguminosarum]MBY3006532.1 hypothetical protein [Rhizobium leguminosarum]MBY5460881.1 hypothetical protein [Rhizobium leguminosarum]